MTAYEQPRTLEQALHRLARDPSTTVLAGGTDFYPALAGKAVLGARRPGPLLDISRVAGLGAIADGIDTWRIGALATWSDIARADVLPPLFNGLKAAARDIGGVQIQNRGTIAGNLCTASPAGDAIPCLLALDAHVRLASLAGERLLPIGAFLTGYRRTALLAGELLVSVDIPKRAGSGHFLKLGARAYLVISIAMVSGTFDTDADGTVRTARIAVGACSAVAQRLPRLEARLIGTRIGSVAPEPDDLAHLTPIDDVRADAGYRRAAALQLVADLLAAANNRSGA